MLIVFAIVLLLIAVHLWILGRGAAHVLLFGVNPCWLLFSLGGLFLLAQIYFWLSPRPDPLTANEAEAVRTAVVEMLEKTEKAGAALPATAAVVHLVSDRTDEATAILRREIAARDGWTLVQGSPAAAFLKGVAKTLYEATSVDEYLTPGRRVGIDVVFYGTLRGVVSTNGVSRADLSLTAYDTRIGKQILAAEAQGAYPRVHTAVGRAVVAKSRSTRGWIFGLLVALLPWATVPLTKRLLERRENGASAAALGGLVVADIFLGLFLFYGLAGHTLATALVAFVCLVYNVACLEILSRRFAS